MPEGSLENGLAKEGSLQYRAWLRGDLWKRYGGDIAQAGLGRGQVNWQRYTELETVKNRELKRVVKA